MRLHTFQPRLFSSKPANIKINTCYGTLRLDVQADAMFHLKTIFQSYDDALKEGVTGVDGCVEVCRWVFQGLFVHESR